MISQKSSETSIYFVISGDNVSVLIFDPITDTKSRQVKLPTDAGSVVNSLLFVKLRNASCLQLPISSGNSLIILSQTSVPKEVNLPIVLGISNMMVSLDLFSI